MTTSELLVSVPPRGWFSRSGVGLVIMLEMANATPFDYRLPATSAANLPDVPTTAEAGVPEFEALLFSSMFAPAGTPVAIINRMNAELGKALRAPDLQQRFADLGVVPAPNSPQEFLELLRGVGDRWGKLIREKNIHSN